MPLANDGNQSFGDISLTTALTYSVNTVWAPVAEHVGIPTMTDYMKRFGFYSLPPLDYPADEMSASRVQFRRAACPTRPDHPTRTSAGSGSARAASW